MSDNVKLSFSYESTNILSEILALDKGIFEPGNIFPWAKVRDSKMKQLTLSIHISVCEVLEEGNPTKKS